LDAVWIFQSLSDTGRQSSQHCGVQIKLSKNPLLSFFSSQFPIRCRCFVLRRRANRRRDWRHLAFDQVRDPLETFSLPQTWRSIRSGHAPGEAFGSFRVYPGISFSAPGSPVAAGIFSMLRMRRRLPALISFIVSVLFATPVSGGQFCCCERLEEERRLRNQPNAQWYWPVSAMSFVFRGSRADIESGGFPGLVPERRAMVSGEFLLKSSWRLCGVNRIYCSGCLISVMFGCV
jgi:hypothetical protein